MPDPESVTLQDVDGTIPGRAALISIELDAMFTDRPVGPMYEGFVEGEFGCVDPAASARALWKSIKGDWAGHTATIAMNHRARFLDTRRQLAAMGIDYTEQDHLSRDERSAKLQARADEVLGPVTPATATD